VAHTDTKSESHELHRRLEELLYPHVAYVGEHLAQATVIKAALTPLDEETIKGYSTCFAVLTLWDGGSIGDAKREAKRVRAALRRPEPPTVEEVEQRAREVLRLEARAIVRDWLEALEGAAVAKGGTLDAGSLDAAMLPPLPPSVAKTFIERCAARLLGVGGTREVLVLERMSLEDPDLCLPHDAAGYLRLQGVTIVP